MNNSSKNKTIWILLVAMMIIIIGASSAAIGSAKTPPMTSMENPPKVWITAGEPSDVVVRNLPPKEFLLNAPQTANITVTYVGAWDAQAQAAFEYAVSIWETQITSPIEIKVEARWANLGAGVLGGAGAATLYRDFTNAPVATTWYPVALANKLSGSDLFTASEDCDDVDPVNVAGPDICASFNSAFSSWYFGTDGNPPSNLYDFSSVVLHELGHGLGFFGTMSVSSSCGGGGIGCWGFGSGIPSIYDRFTENGSGTALLNYPNNSSELGAQLTSNNIFFDGPNERLANGNSPAPLYAPGSWQQGSSYSHLAESYNGTANALMTFSIGPGDVEHNPGPVMLGIFTDMGWAVSAPVPTPTKTPTPTLVPTCVPVTSIPPEATPVGDQTSYLPVVQNFLNCLPPRTATPTPTATATTVSSWTTIVSENFEGSFPGSWELYDTSGGAYQWGKRNCQVFDGSSSGWAFGAGSVGQSLGCGAAYPEQVDTWMIYGPFSLVGATDAELLVKGWVLSEAVYDEFGVMASLDNNYFYGTFFTGNSQGWDDFNLDLTNVPTLGDLRGQANVWIAVGFFSDSTITTQHGAYVDNILLRKCTTGSCPAAVNLPIENSSLIVRQGEKVLER